MNTFCVKVICRKLFTCNIECICTPMTNCKFMYTPVVVIPYLHRNVMIFQQVFYLHMLPVHFNSMQMNKRVLFYECIKNETCPL